MDKLAEQLAASIAYVRENKRQKSDLDEWLDAAPVPPKRLRRKKMTEAIVIHRDVTPVLEFTPEQRQMIRDTYANGASEKEFQVLLEVAKIRRLNPLLKQVHFVKRKNKQLGRDVWTAQVSIDGLRAIAERTGKYDGQDEPEYELNKDGLIIACRVKVYRKDWSRPAVGVAHWDEYVQTTTYDGKTVPTKFWLDMPHVMIAKCAEAIAMRKAFPEDMGGLYVDEEMQQADNGTEGQLGNPRSMHALPGEDPDAPAKESSEFDLLMKRLSEADKAVFDPACTWETMTAWRAVLGGKGFPQTPFGARVSKLWNSEEISAGQRKDLSALSNRVDRKLAQLSTKLKAPEVEASFVDPPGQDIDDTADAFGPVGKTVDE